MPPHLERRPDNTDRGAPPHPLDRAATCTCHDSNRDPQVLASAPSSGIAPMRDCRCWTVWQGSGQVASPSLHRWNTMFGALQIAPSSRRRTLPIRLRPWSKSHGIGPATPCGDARLRPRFLAVRVASGPDSCHGLPDAAQGIVERSAPPSNCKCARAKHGVRQARAEYSPISTKQSNRVEHESPEAGDSQRETLRLMSAGSLIAARR